MGSSEGDEEQQEKEVSTKEEELPRDAVPCQVTISSSVALQVEGEGSSLRTGDPNV